MRLPNAALREIARGAGRAAGHRLVAPTESSSDIASRSEWRSREGCQKICAVIAELAILRNPPPPARGCRWSIARTAARDLVPAAVDKQGRETLLATY